MRALLTWLRADRWRAACVGLVLVLILAGLARVVWTQYWQEQWQDAELYTLRQAAVEHTQTLQQIATWINAKIAAEQAAAKAQETKTP